MAGNIYQWSTTFASNGTADADVPWPEGMARRQVNDSARGIMGRAREFVTDLGGSIAAGGTANGLTVTAASAFTTYADGQIVSFRATANNSGAATLSVNAIGAKAIRKMDSTGDVALAANDIRTGGVYIAQYSAALNGAAGAWLLVNPTLSAAVYALSGLVTVDNTVPRFNGTAGSLQTSGVIISDLNAITGVTALTIDGSAGDIEFASTGASMAFTRDAVNVISALGGSSASLTLSGHNTLILATGATPTNRLSITNAGLMTFAGSAGNIEFASTGANMAFTRNAANVISALAGSSASLTLSGQNALILATGATPTNRLTLTTAGLMTFSGSVGDIEFASSGANMAFTRNAGNVISALAGSSASLQLAGQNSVQILSGTSPGSVVGVFTTSGLTVNGTLTVVP